MRSIRWTAVVVVALTLLILGGLVARNMRFDSATAAMKSGDYATALERFGLLAKLGDSKAQYFLGLMYAFGWGVPKNDDAAIAWFRKAAMWSEHAGDPAAAAEYYVGRSYFEGIGVPRNEMEASRWLKRASDGGYPEAAKGYSKHIGRLQPALPGPVL